CPGPAWGSGNDPTESTSGGPNRVNRTANTTTSWTAGPGTTVGADGRGPAEVGQVRTEVTRKRRADAEDNRRHVVDVARAAFAADGVDLPVREIARRAGLGAATVYRHFPSRQ